MNKPVSRKSNIVVQDLENEVLIYDLTINKAFCLNQTSGLVFALCDGTRTVAGISDEMSKRLKTLVSEDLIYLALDELKKNNLLENSDELTKHFAGMSRREVVKQVGLASVVALPLIASVVAPNAAMAVSGALLQIYASCTTNPECASGNCANYFGGGMHCCVPGTTAVSAPGPLSVFCVMSASQCNTDAQTRCCAGTAIATSPGSFCSMSTTNTVDCICN